MSKEPATVYLCLGSNMGNRQSNLDRALDLLSQRIKVVKSSTVYDTEPVGTSKQPRFLNMVCEVQTKLSPDELLKLAKAIENKMGRTSGHNAPRPIDIDILFYGDRIVETTDLIIPHPRIMNRAFVLIPLDEIAPDLMHPISGRTVREMCSELGAVQGILRWEG